MPITRDQADEIIRRLGGRERLKRLASRLSADATKDIKAPPDVPRYTDAGSTGRDARLALLRERGVHTGHIDGTEPQVPPESLIGNIEQFIGMTQIPIGLIGPVRVNGLNASGYFYVPLATSEGTLVASYHRGARLLTMAGGASCLTTAEQVQRAPGFVFQTVAEAARFAAWTTGEFENFQKIAASRTSHGRLIDLQVHIETRTVYLIFAYYTQDASGQNMVTFCTHAICQDILERSPVKPRHWFIESNMSGDKKATVLSFLQTRGRKVIAEAHLPRALVESVLHTTPERMADYWRMSFVGGSQTGSIGVSGHVANGIAAVFLACGQDVACVSEASIGVTRMELTEDGGLYCGVDLPNLIVGTVGGGTRLPTAMECLDIMQCRGAGNAAKFAEICAAVALGGELSIVGALCAGHFAKAHERLGRKKTSKSD